MAVRLVLAPEVEQDIAEAFAWYEDQRSGLGEEFLASVGAVLEAIRRNPELHPPSTKTTGEDSCGVFLTAFFMNILVRP